jgi:hypothetical protein
VTIRRHLSFFSIYFSLPWDENSVQFPSDAIHLRLKENDATDDTTQLMKSRQPMMVAENRHDAMRSN